MNIKFKSMYNSNTMEELKKAYKEYAFRYHPDMGGSTEDMKELNNAYENLFNHFKSGMNKEAKNYETASKEKASDYMDIIYDIIHIKGLDIEIIGTWLWLGTKGISKEDYNYLYSIGFRWSKAKKLMYKDTLRSVADMEELYKNRKKYKGKKQDDIRAIYGSIKIDNDDIPKRL